MIKGSEAPSHILICNMKTNIGKIIEKNKTQTEIPMFLVNN